MSFTAFKPPHQIIRLHAGKFSAEIWPECGGSIARFDFHNQDGNIRPLFRPTQTKEHYVPTDLACWPLTPYSNRIANGQFVFEGKTYCTPVHPNDYPHALHGFGWRSPWEIVSIQPHECHLQLRHTQNEEWPFSFLAEQVFSLSENGLSIKTLITNTGVEPMPYGLGQHPYIVRPRGTKLRAQVKGVWLTDDKVMPIEYSDLPVKWNLRNDCLLDGVFMDNCFDNLKGAAEVLWPDGHRLLIKGSDNLGFLVVYNPPQEDYVCVEPVSHMTDAFNRAAEGQKDTGFTSLKPGEQAESMHDFIYQAAAV